MSTTDDTNAADRGSALSEGLGAWQPIATAPCDGLPVLLCTDGGIVFVGKLNKHLRLWVDDEGRERFRTVAYWMPLPTPPGSVKDWIAAAQDDAYVCGRNEERKRCKDLVRRFMPAGWSAVYDAIESA
ncbi:MAG TPA: hypothetical protein PKV98_07855 [Burkholderiaceae bacterium]|nr:hypothetical protein [Burkholderiaceae bacterium]